MPQFVGNLFNTTINQKLCEEEWYHENVFTTENL